MRSSLALFGLLLGVLALIAAGGALFTVTQTEQALVLRFGEPVAGRGLITEPGLHYKFPFIENVIFLDNRILDVESPNLEVLASDNQRLEVDSFIRYRIVDPLRFYQSVGGIAGANNQLASVLNSAVRRVLSEANQQQIVRDERAGLMVKIRQQANLEARKFGVDVVDARIRRVDLPQQISEKVYGRMQTERASGGGGISRARRRAGAEDHRQGRSRRDRAEGRGAAPRRSAQGRRRRRAQSHFRRGLRQRSGFLRLLSLDAGL